MLGWNIRLLWLKFTDLIVITELALPSFLLRLSLNYRQGSSLPGCHSFLLRWLYRRFRFGSLIGLLLCRWLLFGKLFAAECIEVILAS